MTARQLGIVVVAGTGLWLVIHAVASLGSALYLVLSASPSDSWHVMSKLVIASLADAVVNGIGGAVLIRLREPLSLRLFPGDSPIALPPEVDFVGALFAVLGVYFVVTAIMDAAPPEIAHWITAIIERGEDLPDYLRGITERGDIVRSRVVGGTRLAIGVALFVGSGSLSRAWYTLRTFGHNREDPSA